MELYLYAFMADEGKSFTFCPYKTVHIGSSAQLSFFLRRIEGCFRGGQSGQGVSRLWLGRPCKCCCDFWHSKIMKVSKTSRPGLGLAQTPVYCVARAYAPELKWLGREAKHSSPSSATIKKIIIIIIIFINCNWVVTPWQWLFYMYSYTKHEIGY